MSGARRSSAERDSRQSSDSVRAHSLTHLLNHSLFHLLFHPLFHSLFHFVTHSHSQSLLQIIAHSLIDPRIHSLTVPITVPLTHSNMLTPPPSSVLHYVHRWRWIRKKRQERNFLAHVREQYALGIRRRAELPEENGRKFRGTTATASLFPCQ